MTNLEALQAMVEYENDNLLAKSLMDRGLDGSGEYTSSNQVAVELAAADVYLVLAGHPDLKEGSRFVTYAKGTLLSMRREIFRKHKLDVQTGLPRPSGAQPW